MSKEKKKTMDFLIDELPGCCGIGVLYGFSIDEDDLDEQYYLQLELDILEAIKEEKKYSFKLLATTSNEQIKIGKILKKLKFRGSKWYKSKTHYTKVKFWQLDL